MGASKKRNAKKANGSAYVAAPRALVPRRTADHQRGNGLLRQCESSEGRLVVEAAWNDGHRFSGRVALVTGAGGTLGGAVARGFGGEGASVLAGYRGSREAAESVAGDVVAGGGVASAFQLDVTDQASVDRFVEQADALYGRIDVLVNAAAARGGGHRPVRAHEC